MPPSLHAMLPSSRKAPSAGADPLDPDLNRDSVRPTGGEPSRSLKQRVAVEVKQYIAFATYLGVVFGTLILFSINIFNRIDRSVPIYPGYHFYALGLINALVVAKFMLIAEAAKLGSRTIGRRIQRRSLLIVILYRALLFTVALVAAYGLEEVLVGAWHGKAPGTVLPEMAGGPRGVLTFSWVMFVALLPYFAYRELDRLLGAGRLRALFLRAPEGR